MLQNESLSGLRVLVVEDELLIAHDLACSMAGRGAEIVGPVGTVADALELIASSSRLDGAVIDLKLHGVMAFPVADALKVRGVPVVFSTGYGRAMLPSRFAGSTCCEKPVDFDCLVRGLLLRSSGAPRIAPIAGSPPSCRPRAPAAADSAARAGPRASGRA